MPASSARPWWRHRWLTSLAGLVLTGGLVYVFVVPRLVEARGSAGLVDALSPWVLVVAVALEAASLFAFTLLTQITLPRGSRPSLPTQVRIDLAGVAISHVLPGGGATAGAYRYAVMTRRGIPPVAAITGAAVQTVLADLALAALFAAAVFGGLPASGSHRVYLAVAALAVVVIAVSLVVLSRYSPQRRNPDAGGSRLVRWLRDVVHVAGDFWLDRDRRTWAIVWALGVCTFDALCLVVCMHAYGQSVPLPLVVAAYGAANLLGLLPLTPGGLGVIEGTLIPALIAFGGGGASVTLAVLTWRLFQFWLPIPVGGACWLWLWVEGRAGAR